jgi:hypothetical protein
MTFHVGDHLLLTEDFCRQAGILSKLRGEDNAQRLAQFHASHGRLVVSHVEGTSHLNGHFIDATTGQLIPALNNNPKGWYVSSRYWHTITLAPPTIEEIDEAPWQGVIP